MRQGYDVATWGTLNLVMEESCDQEYDLSLSKTMSPQSLDRGKSGIVDIQWLIKQHSRKTFVFNILSVGKEVI